MTNIKKIDSRLLSINQISIKSTDDVIYDIEYITMKSSDGSNSLVQNLVFKNVHAYIDRNSTGDKYLIFVFTDKNRAELEIYTKYEKGFIKLILNQMMTYH